MTGLTDLQVQTMRESAIPKVGEIINKIFPNNEYEINIIDNYYHEGAPENASKLWHLGRSIQQMGDADYVYFINNKYSISNGCLIESIIAKIYNLNILNDYE